MPVKIAHSRAPVSHHQFWVADHLTEPSLSPHDMSRNGLAAAQSGVVAIFTGIHTGNVNVTVEIHTQPPALDDTHWDEIIEIPLHAPIGQVRVTALMSAPPTELPVLTDGSGDYRLRIHARGRDTAVDLVTDEPVEDYLLVIWPAPPAPESAHKHSDQYGADLRALA